MNRYQAMLTVSVLGASALLPLGIAGAQSSELPDGPGKTVALENCSGCHAIELLTAQRRTPEEWGQVVNLMVANGAALTEDQYNQVLACLGAYLGKTPASGTAPAISPATTAVAPGTASAV